MTSLFDRPPEIALTVAVRNVQLIADGLKATTTATLAIVNALPIINISHDALTTEVRAINVIVVDQMVPALAAFQERIHNLALLIDI